MGEACLDPVHLQLLQHYTSRIHTQRKGGGGDSNKGDESRAHGGEDNSTVEDSCSDGGGGEGATIKERAGERESVLVVVVKAETATEGGAEAKAEEAATNQNWFSPLRGSEQGEENEEVRSPAVATSSRSSPGGDTSSGDDSDDESEEEGEEDDATATSTSSSSGDTSSSSDSDSSDDSNDEDDDDDKDDEVRPKFEPVVDGVTISAFSANRGTFTTKLSGGGGAGGDGGGGREVEVAARVHTAPTATAEGLVDEPKGATHPFSSSRKSSAAIEDAREITKSTLGSSSSRSNSNSNSISNSNTNTSTNTSSLDSHDRHGSCTGNHRRRQEDPQEEPHRGTSSLPRPVLAGPAATEVAATIGDERGVSFCAAAARKNLIAARKARMGGGGVLGQSIPDRGAGTTCSSTATSDTAPATEEKIVKTTAAAATAAAAPRGKQPSAAETPKSAPTASKTNTAASSPSPGGEKSPPWRTPIPNPTTAAAAAAAAGYQPPGRRCLSDDDNPPAPPPPSNPGELLRTLIEVDAAGRSGAEKESRDGTGSRSPIAKPPAGFGGRAAVDWSTSGTAGVRRQGRVRAMEDAKRLASDIRRSARGDDGGRRRQRADGVSAGSGSINMAPPSSMGEIIAVLLRLTDDQDFKIVRRACLSWWGVLWSCSRVVEAKVAATHWC